MLVKLEMAVTRAAASSDIDFGVGLWHEIGPDLWNRHGQRIRSSFLALGIFRASKSRRISSSSLFDCFLYILKPY